MIEKSLTGKASCRNPANENTTGCKIERDVEQIMKDADAVDNKMMSHHTQYVDGITVTAEMIDEMKEAAKQLVTLTRQTV
jgi:hypothetical protein